MAGRASLQLSVLTVFFLLTNFLVTTGVIYGWAGLQRQLLREGQFRSGCPATGACTSQDYQLGLIPIIAFNLANLATVVHGFTLDRFGVRANAVAGGLLFTTGMLLLSISDSQRFNAFIPAYTLLGWGGIAVFLASFQFANLYSRPDAWRAIINALFTAAGISFTMVDWMSQGGYGRDAVLGLYASVAAVLTVGMLALYPVHAYEVGDECSLPVVEWYTGITPARRHHHTTHAQSNSLTADTKDKDSSDPSDEPRTNEWSTAAAAVEGAGLGFAHDIPLDADGDGVGHEYSKGDGLFHKGATAVSNGSTSTTGGVDPSSFGEQQWDELDAEHRKRHASLWQEVTDVQTLLLSLFFAFGLLASNWFNATIGTQLTAMGDARGDWAIAFIFLSSFLPIPFAVLIAHWFKVLGYSGAVLICTLALSMSYMPLYTDMLGLQWLSFVLYTLARAIVVTVMFAYAATQYRPDHYGRIVAVVTTVATPIGFLQLLMQRESEAFGYKGINTVCALAALPMLLYAWFLKRRNI